MFFRNLKGCSFLLYYLCFFLFCLVLFSFFILVKHTWHIISCTSKYSMMYQVGCISSHFLCHYIHGSRHLLHSGYFVFVCFFSHKKKCYILVIFLRVKSKFLPLKSITLPERDINYVWISKMKTWLVIT